MAFTDSQYDTLMSVYYQHQIENRAEENARKEEIYAAIPRIAEIDRQIAGTSIDAVRTRLQTGTDNMEDVKIHNQALREEKLRLLTAHGYDADYLKPIYTCPLCKDTGWVGDTHCSCFKQAAISLLYRQSTLDQILETENFDHFRLDYYTKEPYGSYPLTPYDNMVRILKIAKTFTEAFDKQGGNLLFYGETGLGKTFLSNCIAKALLDTQHTVLYQTASHLFEEVCANAVMKKGSNPDSDRTYHYLYSCDLLIIDDLGTEMTNTFVSTEIFNILNTRMREKKSTVISTNLNITELMERYSARISSRIFAEYNVCNFYGGNIRLQKRRGSL